MIADDADALRFEDVDVVYPSPPTRALSQVRLCVKRGEMVALLGASGAGKSTLLKCANRLLPTVQRATLSGSVFVLGQAADALHVRDLADRVGVVFQDFEAQLFSTSVEEEIVFGLEQVGVDPQAMLARLHGALAAVGLEGFERRDPATLSGGEKQRLAIAAVFALAPELWVLDEPSTDLDPAARRELSTLLGVLRREGNTLVVAEHDLEPLTGCDRWVVLDRGRIALEGRPVDLLVRPRDLLALGVRPPELALVCERLGIEPWPLDVDAVARRVHARGIRAGRPSPVRRAAGAPLLEVLGARFRHEEDASEALAGVDFSLREGEFVALVGANGSGKSTLARLLSGMLHGPSAVVRWRGKPVAALTARERAEAVGYVFQNPDEQIFAATVEEEIAFGPRQMGWASDAVAARVREVTAAVGLDGLERRDPFLLGKGERQRVAVASILALRPAVLILDEPTTGLDFREQSALMEMLATLHRAGQTIVIITHVPWVVGRYAERAVLLRSGQALFDGAVAALFANEELCRRADFLPPEVARLATRLGGVALDVEGFLDSAG